jgi:hypothetical protein
MQLPFILIKEGGNCHSLLSREEETAIYFHKDGGRLSFIFIKWLGDCHSLLSRGEETTFILIKR